MQVASTFDTCFSLDMLMKLIPYTEDRSHVPRVLEELVESGILESIVAPNIPLAVFAIDHKARCLSAHFHARAYLE